MNIKDFSIIIAGQWNPDIFTPNWVMKNLLKAKEGDEIEVGIDNNLFKLIYKIKGVNFIPDPSFLEFKIVEGFSDDMLEYASNCALQILSMFPHTHKLALGLNYSFDRSILFNTVENNQILQDKDFKVSQTSFKKELENCDLNVILDTKSTIFNYHHKDPNLFKGESIKQYLEETEILWKTL